jgi:hypothetical protein
MVLVMVVVVLVTPNVLVIVVALELLTIDQSFRRFAPRRNHSTKSKSSENSKIDFFVFDRKV